MTDPSPGWKTLQQSAERSRIAADHEQAIEFYIQASVHPLLPWEAIASMPLRALAVVK
jgi:hypothetical protein